MRAVWFLTFITILHGCGYGQKKEIKTFNSFPITEDLEHVKVEVKEPLTPSSIYLLDTLVVLIDRNLDHAIHFYNISNWSSIAKYGKRGNGPAEMRKPKFHGQFIRENDEVYLWFSDFQSYKLKKMNLKEMINNINAEPIISHKLPPELALTYKEIYAIGDNEFIGTVEGDVIGFSGGKKAGRFFRLEMDKKNIEWMPNFPKQKLKVPQDKIGYLYSSTSTFNDRTKQIASAMMLYDRIDIVDVMRDEVLTVVQEDKVKLKEVDLRDDNRLFPLETRFYYSLAYSTDRYVYLLYSNTSEKQSVEFSQGKQPNVPKLQLHVFDWNGTPIYRGQLDKWALGSFFVDEKSWKLYAINNQPENEDDMIISYSLAKLGNEKGK